MSTYAKLNYEQAHVFVEKNKKIGFYWNGWDMVKWTPGPNGFMQKNGEFRNGTWGFSVRIPVTEDGTWRVLEKYV